MGQGANVAQIIAAQALFTPVLLPPGHLTCGLPSRFMRQVVLFDEKLMQGFRTPSLSPKARESVDAAGPSNAERSFAILEFVASRGSPSTASEIGEALGLPKASVYRLIEALEKAALISTHGISRGFVPGPRLVNLSLGVLLAFAGQKPRLVLEALVREVGETCNIGALVNNEIVYIDRVEAEHWPLRLLKAGARVPLHCSAMGKLFLAFLDQERRRGLLERLPLTRHTDRTITEKAALEAELAEIRKEGVALDREDISRASPASRRQYSAKVKLSEQVSQFRLRRRGCLPPARLSNGRRY